MAADTENQLLANFELYSSGPDSNLQFDYMSGLYLLFTPVLVMRKVVLRNASVDLAMTSTQDTQWSDVLQRVEAGKIKGVLDTINTVSSYGFEFSEWYIDVAKDAAVLVGFAEYRKHIKIIMILAGHVKYGFRTSYQSCLLGKSVNETQFLGIGVIVICFSVGLIRRLTTFYRGWRGLKSAVCGETQSNVFSLMYWPSSERQVVRVCLYNIRMISNT
jgi:hypothetical protein